MNLEFFLKEPTSWMVCLGVIPFLISCISRQEKSPVEEESKRAAGHEGSGSSGYGIQRDHFVEAAFLNQDPR